MHTVCKDYDAKKFEHRQEASRQFYWENEDIRNEWHIQIYYNTAFPSLWSVSKQTQHFKLEAAA